VILAQIQKYKNTQIQIQIQIQSKNCKKNWSTIVLQCNGIIIIITIIITIITIIFRELQCNWQFPLCIVSAMQRYGSSSSSSSSPSSSPSSWCSAMASLSSSSSSNHYLPNSSWAIPKCIHDWSNVLSEIFSPLFLIRGGGGDEKSLEKWESGTGVRTKLKILAWVPLVIVFFYI